MKLRKMLKPICFFFGCKPGNMVLTDLTKASVLGHLCSEAGLCFVCRRCGDTWDDLSAEARTHFIGKGLYPHQSKEKAP